jgi:hypothetical protein
MEARRSGNMELLRILHVGAARREEIRAARRQGYFSVSMPLLAFLVLS